RPIPKEELRVSLFRHVPYAGGGRWIYEVPAAYILTRLFKAGATTYFASGAHGRLVGLRTLGALVGAAPDEPVDAVIERSEATTFLAAHETDTMALMALRPDGTLAVLAGEEQID